MPALAAEKPARATRPSYTYDPARRRKATKAGRQAGCQVYIPRDELLAAGLDPDEPIYYRTVGYKRSARGHTVIVTLYTEP